MSTKVATIVVAGMSTTTRYVDKFLVECYSNVGLTNLVTTKFVGAVWDGTSLNLQKGIITFKGLTFGATYYFRAGVVAPITGNTAWSATYSLVAGTATGPSAVTYTGNYEATTSGIAFTLTPASVPSDIDHYEVTWTYDGSVPASNSLALVTVNHAAALNFFSGGKPGDRVSAYVRAVNTSHQQQIWTSLGTVGIALVAQDAIVHQGTSPGGGGDTYSYRQFSTASYTIVSGDRFEYDVYEEFGDPVYKAGVDFHYTAPGARFVNIGGTDQNGVSTAATTDLSTRIKGRWYHREFNITALAGKVIDSWATFLEGDTAGNYKAKFANIRIMNGSTVNVQAFGTGAVPVTSVMPNSPGENYTSVIVHTAQTSVGSINTAQIIDQAVVGTKAALTASARDINKNLFGDPNMIASPSGTALTLTGPVESWLYAQDGTGPTDTPEFRNHGELRIPKVTATGGTYCGVLQFKSYTRFYFGLNYAFRVWVRINSGDATPNGNFTIQCNATDSVGNVISSFGVTTTPGSAITSSPQLAVAYFPAFPLPPGARFYTFLISNTSTNTDLYITQAMLNRGTQVSDYTDDTYLQDVNQYAYEGYGFVDDNFNAANGTAIPSHYPDTAGFEWAAAATSGTLSWSIQSNAAKATFSTVGAEGGFTNNRCPLGAAYSVQADVKFLTTLDGWMGVIARFRDDNNYYRVVLTNVNLLIQKRVAGTFTTLGTFAFTPVLGTTYNVKLVVTNSGQKAYLDGTLRITTADGSFAWVSTEKVGFFASCGATVTTPTPTVDNFLAIYLQNVGTPPTPPVGNGGGGGGDPGSGGHCVVGTMLFETRSGEQMGVDLWQKFVLNEWTANDDILNYNFDTKQFQYSKPNQFWVAGVQSTFISSFDDEDVMEMAERHRIFNSLATVDSCTGTNDVYQGMPCQLADGSLCHLTSQVENPDSNVVYYLEMPTLNYVAKGKSGKVGKVNHNLKIM
jgi:hypothetical protein